nr:hypothetical protein [Pseudomonas sp. P818]
MFSCLIRFFLFFAFSLVSFSSYSSQPYVWTISYEGLASGSSPSQACSIWANNWYNPNWKASLSKVVKSSDTRFLCYYDQINKSNGTVRPDSIVVNVDRSGTGCANPDDVYNSDTGECSGPLLPNGEVCGPKNEHTGLPKIKNSAGECVDFHLSDKPSQCKFAQSRVREVKTVVQFDSNGVPSGPPSVDVQGCVAVPVGPNPYKNCKQSAPRKACFNGVCVEMQSTAAECSVVAQFTGEAGDGEFGFTGNPADGAVPCDPDTDCTPATPPVETDRQPCNYHHDSPERQSCVSFDYKGVPGESSQCGQVNGVMQCIAKRPASSNGTQIDTTVETKSNPDGTTTTTKTDIRTDVICSGPNACQSVTTKTTNVTIKDGNGNTTSSDTKCEGAKCASGIGKGDGTGTGEGDCIVNCDDENGQVSAPELGEVATYAESIQAFQAAIEGSPIMSAVSSIAVTGSGSCNMGSTNTAIGTISLDYICTNSNWLDSLYFVFLAVWALAAVRVLLSA